MKNDVGKIAFVIHGRYIGASGEIVDTKGPPHLRYAIKVAEGMLIPIFRRTELYIIDPDITEAEGLKHEEVAKALCQRHQ